MRISTTRTTTATRIGAAAAVVAVLLSLFVPGGAAGAAGAPVNDAFHTYTGSTPLADIAAGTVLKSRTVAYHVSGVPLPLSVVQLQYRTVDAQGRPTVNVTSVIRTPLKQHTSSVVAYESFYDSLNPLDGPSYAIAGGVSLGGSIPSIETLLIAPLLLQGYSVVVTDTQGRTADFAAGPEYGYTTLDALRAASASAATGVDPAARIGVIGYSGGAIGTNWTAALAPGYAPDINRRLVGAAEGGVLVDPDHNLHYVDGSKVWAGVVPMALIGAARAYDIDLMPYLSDYGKSVFRKVQYASISTVLGAYPGLTFASLAKPQYATAESIPAFVTAVNKLNLGSAPRPTVPMFIGQGADGVLEGTPGFGLGDGVMVAGDVRSLARQYCAGGTRVMYRQYPLTSHFTSVPQWLLEALPWLTARFAGVAAPQNCAQIPAGNALTPVPTAG